MPNTIDTGMRNVASNIVDAKCVIQKSWSYTISQVQTPNWPVKGKASNAPHRFKLLFDCDNRILLQAMVKLAQ